MTPGRNGIEELTPGALADKCNRGGSLKELYLPSGVGLIKARRWGEESLRNSLKNPDVGKNPTFLHVKTKRNTKKTALR